MACSGLKFLESEIDSREKRNSELVHEPGQSNSFLEASSANPLASPMMPEVTKKRTRNSTERILDLALDMFKHVESTTFEMGVKLTLKIGIHHGNCTYGVIGYHKPQFSLIGDTVNTTSRHCTTGDPGTIVMSSAAFAKMPTPRRYPPFKRKQVPMKGKGDVEVFMLKPTFILGELVRKNLHDPLHLNTKEANAEMNFTRAAMRGLQDSESQFSSLNDDQRQVLSFQLGGENFSPGVTDRRKRFEFYPKEKTLIPEGDSDPQSFHEDADQGSLSLPSQNSKSNKRHFQQRHMTSQVGGSGGLKLSVVPQQSSREELGSIDQENNKMEIEISHSAKIESTPHQVNSWDRQIYKLEPKESEFELQRAISSSPSLPVRTATVDLEAEPDSESEEEDDYELKSRNTEKMAKVMKAAFGYAYTFRKGKEALKAFYSKQMRLKYRTKLRKTLFNLVALIFVQEIFIWISFRQGYPTSSVRVGFFGWIFVTLLYLFLSSKVYKQIVVVLVFFKTFLYAIELYMSSDSVTKTKESQAFNMNLYCLYFISQMDAVLFVTVGIFTVTELLFLNAFSYLLLLIHLIIYKQSSNGLVSLVLNTSVFYLYNIFDIINHFDTEINTFFNFIKIEQRGYYLTTFVERLLPKHIRGVASSGTERYENVTLLFADIVGFTEYSAGKNPRQVVQMLSQLFTAFDKECNSLDLYKLYTIGDCYVVMSFLDKNNRKSPAEEAADVLRLSVFMLQTIQKVRVRIKFDKLNMRIGIHTGTVFGGVIGTDIVRFDLYGPDVLTANKMESGGEPGQINVSQTTKSLLDSLDSSNFTFRQNKEIEIKSLGRKLHSYFLNVPPEQETTNQASD